MARGSGFGALGWNKAKLQETLGTDTLTSLDQLWDPKLKGRITVLSEMRDTMGIIMAWQGADPSNFTDDQYQAAIAEFQSQIDSGQIRQVAGNDYVAALETGDVIAVIGETLAAGRLDAAVPACPARICPSPSVWCLTR